MWPIVRALARRIEPRRRGRRASWRDQALHQRVAELEQVESRLGERKIASSFRAVTQHRESAALERGGRP
jgi:hypothetical protein